MATHEALSTGERMRRKYFYKEAVWRALRALRIFTRNGERPTAALARHNGHIARYACSWRINISSCAPGSSLAVRPRSALSLASMMMVICGGLKSIIARTFEIWPCQITKPATSRYHHHQQSSSASAPASQGRQSVRAFAGRQIARASL